MVDHEQYDGQAVYFDLLAPCISMLSSSRGARLADQDMTDGQECLALAGIAHLEILNGGAEQMLCNWADLSTEVPAALARLGLEKAAADLGEAIQLWLQLQSEPTELDKARAEDLDDKVAAVLESQRFYAAVVKVAEADRAGFLAIG